MCYQFWFISNISFCCFSESHFVANLLSKMSFPARVWWIGGAILNFLVRIHTLASAAEEGGKLPLRFCTQPFQNSFDEKSIFSTKERIIVAMPVKLSIQRQSKASIS